MMANLSLLTRMWDDISLRVTARIPLSRDSVLYKDVTRLDFSLRPNKNAGALENVT